MNDVLIRIVASLLIACLLCISTIKFLGGMQQGGYKNGLFFKWLKRKDNMLFNRLCVLTLCLILASAVTSLCFSFLGTRSALFISALPFIVLLLGYCYSDRRYGLKVPMQATGRIKRLFAVYVFFTACVAYLFMAALKFLAEWNGSEIYRLIAYTPFSVLVLLLSALLAAANAVTGIFENARNKKFVKRAGQVLDESNIIRVGIVGSYGKTSVKNILKTLLEEKYSVVETPSSYNTPMGIAKTVFSEAFAKKEVFIAEMGARKAGDIAELCRLVKPDYAVFTGVCAQHIQTFGSVEAVFEEKSEILKSGVKCAICGESLENLIKTKFPKAENIRYAKQEQLKDVRFFATKTEAVLCLGGEEISFSTSLLGESTLENILLAASLAYEMGLTVTQIQEGLKKLSPIPHRLQLMENAGVYILDDSYNCNPEGAKIALGALKRFEGRKCIVTPGIIEGGILEESINKALGEDIANAKLDKVILVGDTLIGAVKSGYVQADGEQEKITVVSDLKGAQKELSAWLKAGDTVLFLNDLPDVY